LVGQEYELEKKLTPPNPKGRNQYSEVGRQNDAEPQERTRERLAKDHGVSTKTVERSADLYNSVKIIGDVAPSVGFRLMDSHEKEVFKGNAPSPENLGVDRDGSHNGKGFAGCLFQPPT